MTTAADAGAQHPSSMEELREETAEEAVGQAELPDLLSEVRILLPGTQVFLGFLATLPFSTHFRDLDHARRVVYVWTFVATVLALVLFLVPAAYHRLARPIRHKERFLEFANHFLVAGLVPLSVSMILVTYLVTYVVTQHLALYLSSAVALLIVLVWWAMPMLRLHNRFPGGALHTPAPSNASGNGGA